MTSSASKKPSIGFAKPRVRSDWNNPHHESILGLRPATQKISASDEALDGLLQYLEVDETGSPIVYDGNIRFNLPQMVLKVPVSEFDPPEEESNCDPERVHWKHVLRTSRRVKTTDWSQCDQLYPNEPGFVTITVNTVSFTLPTWFTKLHKETPPSVEGEYKAVAKGNTNEALNDLWSLVEATLRKWNPGGIRSAGNNNSDGTFFESHHLDCWLSDCAVYFSEADEDQLLLLAEELETGKLGKTKRSGSWSALFNKLSFRWNATRAADPGQDLDWLRSDKVSSVEMTQSEIESGLSQLEIEHNRCEAEWPLSPYGEEVPTISNTNIGVSARESTIDPAKLGVSSESLRDSEDVAENATSDFWSLVPAKQSTVWSDSLANEVVSLLAEIGGIGKADATYKALKSLVFQPNATNEVRAEANNISRSEYYEVMTDLRLELMFGGLVEAVVA